MQPTTRNIFHTSLAFHPSSLSERRSIRLGNRRVESQRCPATGSRYGTRGMEASSWILVRPELWRTPQGGNG
jgi:hypothetical protein